MKSLKMFTLIAAGVWVATAALAQTPAGAPAGSTGLCKDGSYYSGATRKGACRGHKGVKDWWGAAGTAAPATAAAAPASAMKSTAAAAARPAGSTGLCKDGSYYSGATRKGACRGHKGVKDWWGPEAAAAPAMAMKSSAAPAASPSPASTAMAPAMAPTPAPRTPAPRAMAAAGGGAGQVWVNHPTKVYHCPGDRWYGKTKDGEYMTEAEAGAKGYRPDHGKPCK